MWIGMRLENGVDLLGVENLLSLEHAAAGLIDDLPSQAAVALEFFSKLVKRQVGKQVFAARGSRMLEGRSRPVDDLLGNADEFTILAGLLLVPLRRGHPLDLQRASSRRARAVAKPLDRPSRRVCEPADQASDDTDDIPQQGVVGGMMNVRLSNRGVDA